MVEEKGLAIQQQGLFPTTAEWEVMNQITEAVFKSGFLPSHIKNPAQALAIILKGRELNIPPMQALSSLFVVNQKVTAQSDLMLALALRTGEISFKIEEDSNEICKMKFFRNRNGQKMEYEASFSMIEAKSARLSSKDIWQKYPKALIRARTIAIGLRVIAADVIAGLYTPKEMGVKTIITKEGEEQVVIEDGKIVIEQNLQKPDKDDEIVELTTPPPTKPDPLLIKIHELLNKMEKKGYTDELYRQDLQKEFKVDSSKDLNEEGKQRLITFLVGKLNALLKAGSEKEPEIPADMQEFHTVGIAEEIGLVVKKLGITIVAKEFMQTFYGVSVSKNLSESYADDFLQILYGYRDSGMNTNDIITDMTERINREKEAKAEAPIAK